jgi:MYXO-CTERM domain-containing protein
MRTSKAAALFALCAFAGVTAYAGRAAAEDCSTRRPTDAGGFAGYAYGASEVKSYATAHIRVWYTIDGANAVRPQSTRADLVPDDVAVAGDTTEAAYGKYLEMGFRAPLGDGGHPACVTNGGDDKIDVYLLRFQSADGQTVHEQCKPGAVSTCPTFIMAEARLDQRYGSYAEGVRTVLVHELFHSVQSAYNAEMDGFWLEGSAQWAAKTVSPEIGDLERLLPDFFKEVGRSIDSPPGGAAVGFLYGAAVWPVFLDEHFGKDAVRTMMEELGSRKETAMAAADLVLPKLGSSTGDAFPLFLAWNAATGSRAGTGGYKNAAKYPKLVIGELPEGDKVDDLTAGFSYHMYHTQAAKPTEYTLDTDPARNRGMLLPLTGGVADVARAKPLPATLEGEGIVIVTGVSAKKSDAAFTLRWQAPNASSSSTSSSSGGSGDGSSGGCSAAAGSAGSASGTGAVLAAVALCVLAARRRKARHD